MTRNNSTKETILFYDGECGFCNSMVALVLKNERDQAIRFCDESGKPDAMSVCLAILARIKVKTGLVADGITLLTQVKNYWQQKGHRKWIDHFSDQLSELEQYAETI